MTTRPATGIVAQMGRLIAIHAGGFCVLTLLLFVLEEAGLPREVVVWSVVLFPLLVAILIGVLARTTGVAGYFAADRGVPAVWNGMAIAGAWLSVGIVAGYVGAVHEDGMAGLAFGLASMAGLGISAILVAPFLAKSGARTVPEFLAVRFGSVTVRLLAMAVVLAICLVLLIAQFTAAAHVISGLAGVPFDAAILVATGLVLFTVLPGGMRGATWTQCALYLVVVIAFIVPLAWMAALRGGAPLPFVYPEAVSATIADIEAAAGGTGSPASGPSFWLVASIALGTAVFPHLITRAATTAGSAAARLSFVWAMVFLLPVIAAVPGYAMMIRLDLYDALVGIPVARLAEVVPWAVLWAGPEDSALVWVCGVPATGLEALAAACGSADHVITPADVAMDRGLLLLALPDIAGLPLALGGLITAALLAAALSTAGAVVVTFAGTAAQDLHYAVLDRRATSNRRMLVARLMVLGVAALAARLAMLDLQGMAALMAATLSLAAAALFPAVLVGIWWRRATAPGAIAAIVVGIALVGISLFNPDFAARLPSLAGTMAADVGAAGAVVGTVVIMAISMLSAGPDERQQRRLDAIRRPAGHPVTEGTDL